MAREPTPKRTRAKAGAEESFGKRRSDHRWFRPVLAELKRIFPRKLAQELAVIANRSERICEVWISGKGAPDGEALAALLNSKHHGRRIWQALTADNPHPWRAQLNRQIEIWELLELQQATARRLEALERGEK
jgi:hypothetical protein